MSAAQDRLNAKKKREEEEKNAGTVKKLTMPTLAGAATQTAKTGTTTAKTPTVTKYTPTATTVKINALGAGGYGADKTAVKKLTMPTLAGAATQTAKTGTAATKAPTATKYTPTAPTVKINALGAGSYGADKQPNKGYSYGQGVAKAGLTGLGNVAQMLSTPLSQGEQLVGKGLELITGKEQGKGLFERWDDSIKAEQQAVAAKYAENTEKGGKYAEKLEGLEQSVFEALPSLGVALATGGGSAAAKAADLTAQTAGKTGIASIAKQGAKTLLKDPNFITSAMQIYSGSYNNAKAEGASELQATAYALANAGLGGYVEIQGGLQKLPKALQGDETFLKALAKTMLEEGTEEVEQGVIDRALQRVGYGADNPLLGVGENGIIDPVAAAEEFAGGAIVGGLLGGGTMGVNAALKGLYNRAQQTVQAGTTGAAGRLHNENGLAAYTPQERVNLSSGARNRVVTTYQEALAFVKNALSNRNNVDRAYMGIVPDSTAQKVANETGVNISGYGATLHSDNVRHIVKNHGDSRTEILRGQMGVAAEDIANIPKILAAPDRVYLSEKPDSRGRRVLVFEKTFGDNLVTMQAVSDGTHSLQTDTLYKQKKKNPQDTEYYNVGESADPAHNVRNVPPQGSSVNIIPQRNQNVKAPQVKIRAAQAQAPALQMPTLDTAAVKNATVTDGAGLVRSDYSRTLANTDYALADTLNRMGQAAGVRIELVDSLRNGRANGEYDMATNTIRIAADAENPVQTVAAHELTHHLQVYAPQEYAAFRQAAEDYFTELYGGEGVTALVNAYKQVARDNGVTLTDETALDEMAADFTETLLNDADLFGRFAKENRTAAQKLLDGLKEFIAKIKATLTGKARDAAAQNAYGKNFSELEQVAQKWQTAYDAAVERAKNAETAANEGGGVRYQVKQLANGMKYVQADRQVTFGNDPVAWSEQLENYINGKIRHGENVQLIAEDGDILTLTAKSAGKLSSRYTNNGRTMSDEAFERKANAAAHIDELAQVSRRGKRTVFDEGSRHGSMAENGWNYRTAYFRDFDGTYYRATISVAQGADGNMIYNIGQMKKEAFPKIEGSYAVSGNDPRGNTSQKSAQSGDADVSTAVPTIRSRGGNVNSKFSMKGSPAVDSAGRELSPQQQEYFKDSKARDAEGRLLKLYHQTEGGFTVFDTKNTGAGRSDGETPFGIFLKSNSKDIGLRGKTQMELYANIVNPLYAENREDLSRKVEFLSPEYARIKQEHRALDAEYGAKVENAKREWVSFITEWRKNNPDAPRTALYDVQEFNRLFDAEDVLIQEWTKRADVLSTKAKETVTNALRKSGYDGVVLGTDKGSFGRSTDAFIALDPEQVKNADNVSPTGDADIRYSLKGSNNREVISIKQQIARASEQLNRTEPVAVKNVTPLLNRMNIKQKRAWAEAEALKYGGRIDRQGYGSIEVSRKDINSALNYLQDDGEIAAFSALPAVLKRGREIYREDDHKGRSYGTVTFAAPVVINGTRGNMAAVVRETSKNHYDMHRIVMPDGSAFTFNEKINAETGPTAATPYNDALTQPTGSASNATIRSHSENVNSKFSLKGSRDIEQELRENGDRNRQPYWQTSPDNVPVTREQAAQRMAEEAAARARREEEGKAIPKTLETVGVAPYGSEADYTGAETLAENAGANERSRRRMRREMEKVPATEKERLIARQIAGGQLDRSDVPNSVNRETVDKLVDFYTVMDSGAETELLRQKRNTILEREEAKMEGLLGMDVDYDEGGMRESGKPSGKVRKTFSTLRRNLQTPARICATEWGAAHGSQVYETLFYPVAENNGRQVEWVNSMMDRVRTFTDSSGKQRELTRAERAVVQRLVETRAAADRVAQFDSQYAPAAENVKNGESAEDAAREFGITKKMPEYEDLLHYEEYLSAQKDVSAAGVDAAAVDEAVEAYSGLYSELYKAINTFLTAHGYKPIGFIEGYAPHMQPETAKTGFSKAMKLLGLDDTAMMLPTSISGQTADLKPYKQYDPFFQTRYGDKTEYDIAKGFESYVYYLGNIFYHTDDIMRLRTAARYIRKTYSSEEAGEQISWAEGARDSFSDEQIADFLQMNGITGKGTRLSGEDARARLNEYIDELYEQIDNVTRYSEMVKYLDNYANRLAGKQNMADRGAEAATGRGSLNWINALTGKFGGAKLAFNVSSALNQTAQLPMVAVENGEANTAKAIKDFCNRSQAEAFAKSSNFLKGKKGVQWLVGAETNWEKFKEAGFTMTEAVDSFTAFVAVRSKYLKEIKAGKNHAAAMKAADEFGRNVMGSRARGEKPMLFDTKNPFWQIVTRFQLEAMNSWEHISRDVPQEIQRIAKEKGKTQAAKTLAWRAGRYVLYAFLANWGIGTLSGGSPVPYDVLGTIMEAVGAATGITKSEAVKRLLDDVLEAIFDERLFGTDEPEDDEEKDWWAAFESLFGNVANDVPVVGRVAALTGIGDQTLPVTDLSKLADFGKSVKNDGLFSTETLDKGLTAAGEFAFGGNQLRKTAQGTMAVAQGGVYDSSGRRKYEVAQTPWKAAQGALFGRSALKESQDYYAGSDTKGEFATTANKLTAAKNEGDETAEVVSRWWNRQQSQITEINRAVKETSDREERRALEDEADAIRENTLEMQSTYTAAVEKYLSGGMDTDEAYREANRECFGTEYALEAYSKDVYERARNVVQSGDAWNISYDDFYEYYFGTKDIEATGNASATALKLSWLYNSGMPESTQAELWLTDMASDSVAATQKELERNAGITLEQFYEYKLTTVHYTKKEQKMQIINTMDLTTAQKNALYFSEGWAESKLGEAPWYSGVSSRSTAPTIRLASSAPTIRLASSAPTIRLVSSAAPTIRLTKSTAPTIRRIR